MFITLDHLHPSNACCYPPKHHPNPVSVLSKLLCCLCNQSPKHLQKLATTQRGKIDRKHIRRRCRVLASPERREKIGAVNPFSENLSTSWSNIKEEEALHRYKMITQHKVSPVGFRVHGKADWLAASADGMIDSSGVLEIKCPFFDGEKSKAWPWLRIPAQCVLQAQGLMEILDKEWMHFYVWTLNGSSLFKLYRDREYWGVLEEALSDFWWKHVVSGREVYGNREKTVRRTHLLLKPFRPAERHEMFERIVCESRRIVCRSELLVREVHGRMQN